MDTQGFEKCVFETFSEKWTQKKWTPVGSENAFLKTCFENMTRKMDTQGSGKCVFENIF